MRREGHYTDAQKRAVAELLPRYALPDTGPIDPAALFGRDARRECEIGFGNGETLATLAAAHPETDFIGIEVYRPGVGRLLRRLAAEEITNVRVSGEDAFEVLARWPEGSLDGVWILFPDPWPKKRQWKRRIVNATLAAQLARLLRPGGFVHLATDWEDYAHWMRRIFDRAEGFADAYRGAAWAPGGLRPATKFEARGERLGHAVFDLRYVRWNGGGITD